MATEKQLLKELEKDTVDSASWAQKDANAAEQALYDAESRMRGAAAPQIDGTLRSFHVTDDPARFIDVLEGRAGMHERAGDLCTGLYVSTAPNFWESRSQKQWDFLKTLSPDSVRTLIQAIRERVGDFVRSGYITRNEYENATRVLEQAEGGYLPVLDIVANQPFNINIPDLAKALKIATPFEPIHVPVDFTGRYLEFNTRRAIDAYMELLRKMHGSAEGLTRKDLCDLLKNLGWDGVFTKAGFGTNPELVIWNTDKILTFGDWTRHARTTLGANPKDATWLVDPMGESRVEAVINQDKTRAIIFDKLLKERFDFVNKQDVMDLGLILLNIGAGEPIQSIGRFESRLLYNMPQIRDTFNDRYFRGLKPKDLDDLEHLVEEMLSELE